MKLAHGSAIVGCVCVVLVASRCTKDATSTTTTTSAPAAASTTETGALRWVTATARISGARCDREDMCDPFRTVPRYDGRADCDRAEYARAQRELPASACPFGIDEPRLRTCLSVLTKRECVATDDSLEMIDECHAKTVCLPAP